MMELGGVVLQFVKFGPHTSSNSIYDINNGETNKIVVRQFKGEHGPNEYVQCWCERSACARTVSVRG